MENVKPTQFSPYLIADTFKSLYTGVIDLIYPPLCLICDDRLEQARMEICKTCLNNFKLIGTPHGQFSVTGDIYLSTAWALFEFDDSFQQLIHHLKYSRRRKPIGVVLDHYKSQILDQLPVDEIDLVISVPLHPRKFRERGYNQVDDMSNWLAGRLHVELGNHLVKRKKYTSTQTKLNAEERMENVRAAFGVTDESAVRGKHVLLVDDVLTTGATSNALAEILKQSGAAKIDLITLSTPQFGNA
ncbi:MAG: ComF family protein [Candidatus Marinimicrobia bacterium]|nr:ComF family protein [Candidatus Neomarinimicrobiota bacterium]MBT3574583.1 ComF family protein [Candidatus Neomarinimicrobiota bacterium]MBT3680449.1 ComF family protein [Candidatus Neomarinimicrobiota bacterium]MBT3951006.1 ComF family protein [Candidatus Neomarinimicrobiota bacterium]MBT4253046.1 ComF family protein [Candidatus Neomarinimicrobiota bacterium]